MGVNPMLLILISFLISVNGLKGQTPLRPASGIHDPEGWLGEGEGLDAVAEITAARGKEGALVFVVILPEEASDGANQVALAMGRSWGGDRLWGIALHVIGDPESPRYFGEFSRDSDWSEQQKEDFQASILRALSKAGRSAKLSTDPRVQLASGTRILTEELSFLGLLMERIEHNNGQARGDRGGKFSPKVEAESGASFGDQSIFQVVMGVLIVILILVFFRSKSEDETVVQYYFPETLPRKRFLGPWSGGGNVLIHFNTTKRSRGESGAER